MKKHFQKIFNTPKIATSIAIVIALVVGVISFINHNKTMTNEFAKINTPSTFSNKSGSNLSSSDLTLAFPIGGRIKSVSVKIGDVVKAGTVLASLDAENAIGAVNQAKGAYTAAETSYEKLVNGASSPDIEVARVALNNAKNSYNTTVSQQKVLVSNALSAMLNSGLTALPTIEGVGTVGVPTISGTYSGTEGTYTISTYSTGNGAYFSISGIETGSGLVSTIPVALGTHGLKIQFPTNNISSNINNTWTISIPNTQAPTYLVNYNLYQSALQTQSQALATAQGMVDTAQAALDQKVAGARSEDLTIAKAQVESTQGALQVAEGNYNNTIIRAPVDGTITNITITAGQIATPNTPAIELLSK